MLENSTSCGDVCLNANKKVNPKMLIDFLLLVINRSVREAVVYTWVNAENKVVIELEVKKAGGAGGA